MRVSKRSTEDLRRLGQSPQSQTDRLGHLYLDYTFNNSRSSSLGSVIKQTF